MALRCAGRSAVRFGVFEIDLNCGELRKRGTRLKLQEQPFRILVQLLEHPGVLVTREQLRETLWPQDTYVEFEHSINAAVAKLRQTLGDSAESPRFVETLAKRGYRFIAPIQVVITNDLPDPIAANGPVPGPLNKAIQKLRQALDDSPDNPRFVETLPRKGYRFIAPVDRTASETSVAKGQSVPVEGTSVSPGAKKPVKWRNTEVLGWLLFGVVSVALVVLGGLYFQVFRSASQPMLKTAPLTSYPGWQISPAFSPDGKQVAFAWGGEKGENFDIYVKLVGAGAGTPLRLTSSPAPEWAPAWSPDGSHIAFCRDNSASIRTMPEFGYYLSNFPNHIGIWTIPALGGTERKLGESAGCGLSWSPDRRYLALADKNAPKEPYSIVLLSVETGDKRKLTSPPGESFGDWSPQFSPDGKALAFVRGNTDRGEAYVLPVTSDGRPLSEPRRLTLAERLIYCLDWTADGRRIVYSSGPPGSRNLLTIPASGGVPERAAVTGEDATALSISRTGSRLVYAREAIVSNIWRIPGPNSSDKRIAPSRFIASTQSDVEPQFSPDGTKIVFSSARSGNDEIWVCDREGQNSAQLTSFNGPELGSPRWSPDSQWIAFDSPKAGNADIYVIKADGGQPRRVTSGPSNNVRGSWSWDGRWIYFGSNRSGDWQIWKQPVQGGTAVQVTRTKGREAFESFDGKFVYYAKPNTPGVFKVPVAGGEETRVLDRGGQNVWALTGQGICFFDLTDSTGTALKFYNFATRKVTFLRDFSNTALSKSATALSVSPGGRWILYMQLDRSGSNLMLVENFR